MRPSCLIQRQFGEVERAAEIRAVVESALAPIRQLEARLHEMTTLRPTEARVHLHVGLGAEQVSLRTTAGECARDDDPLVRRHADARLALLADEDLELAHARRAAAGPLRARDLLFPLLEVRAA